MKRLLLLSILFLTSCNLIESISPNPVIIQKDGVEIADGTVFEMTPGDYMSIEALSGNNRADVSWSSSDESVAIVTWSGEIYVLHGGETTITATMEDGKKISFRIRIPVIPHGDIYFACGSETASHRLYINGVAQNQTCTLLDSDELGNIWVGVQEGNNISLSKNGVSVLKDHSFQGLADQFQSLRAKGGKAYLYVNNSDATACQYMVFSADGSYREGVIDLTQNEWDYPYGYVVAMDEDAQGNLIFWGSIKEQWVKYAHRWTVAPDGTVSGKILDYWNEEHGYYDLMGVPADAALDADGNTYYLVSGENSVVPGHTERSFEVWKNDKFAYFLSEDAEIVNSGLRGKMVVRGNDVWFAASEVIRAGEDWWDKDYGLIVYKNGKKQYTAATGDNFGGVGLSVTSSGDVYTLHLADGAIVTKNGTPILSIPIANCWSPVFAVKE